MLNETEERQLDWHFTLAVCRTYLGCRVHLENTSLKWRWLLCGYFGLGCDVSKLPRAFWVEVNRRRKDEYNKRRGFEGKSRGVEQAGSSLGS